MTRPHRRSLSLNRRPRLPQHPRRRHGGGRHNRRAATCRDLKRIGKRAACRIEQRRPCPTRQLRRHRQRAAQRAARDQCGVNRYAGQRGVGHGAAVHGRHDAADDGNAERAAQLKTGF